MIENILKRPLFFACAVACACAFLFSSFTPIAIFAFLIVMIFAASFMIPFKCRLIMPSVFALILCIIIAISSSLRYYFAFAPACDYVGTSATVNGTVVSVDGNEVVIKCNKISLDDSSEKVCFKILSRHTGTLQLFPSSVVTAKVTFDDKVSRNGNGGAVLTGEITDITVRKNFDLRPAGIIKMLDLRRPIYKQTAAYGHFGRNDLDLPWEKLDKVDTLKAYL